MKYIFSLLLCALTVNGEDVMDTCGHQCSEDYQCFHGNVYNCGTAGKCSCPDGKDIKFAATSCSCTSAPASPPSDPPADVADSVWPTQWTATVDSLAYTDGWGDKTGAAHGKFYYDAMLSRTRADWKPYTNGKNALQIWVAETDTGKSKYYVKSGPLCLYFPVPDPGVAGKPGVGVERPDWVKNCKDAGYAHYVGREQVRVDGADEWADHWSCRVEYAAANNTITFQNWHSIGLGKVPKGLPLRVTGGNAAIVDQGAPRLATSWYNDFVTGPNATKASDFDVPFFNGELCIPVASDDAEAFFGHSINRNHVTSGDFHRRAHYLPHATPNARDLVRARRPKPVSKSFVGDNFAETMQKLNAALLREKGLKTKECHEFSLEDLQEMQRALFDARTPALDKVYKDADDTRRMAHANTNALLQEQAIHASLEKESPELAKKARAGVCHEMVMWYVHHLSATARGDIKDRLILPQLPEEQHEEPPSDAEVASHNVHKRYTQQVSCAICHVTKASEKDGVVLV